MEQRLPKAQVLDPFTRETCVGASAPSVVVVAAVEHPGVAKVLDANQYAVVRVHTGTLAHEWTRDINPDAVILADELPDMTGVEACRLMHRDPHIGLNVPILIFSVSRPTPEQRVAALQAGAWDFRRYPDDPEEFSLKLQAYVQAKRNIDGALHEGIMDQLTGLHSRPGLARRARELGSLMARTRGALTCLVFAVNDDPADAAAGRLVAQTARVSDVVGQLGPTDYAVLAPGTDRPGAVKLAERVGQVLRTAGTVFRAGYVSVDNLKYAPVDPVGLIVRAAAAVRTGAAEPALPWLRCADLPNGLGDASYATPDPAAVAIGRRISNP